jgi:hypothetical protein
LAQCRPLPSEIHPSLLIQAKEGLCGIPHNIFGDEQCWRLNPSQDFEFTFMELLNTKFKFLEVNIKGYLVGKASSDAKQRVG